eukprot:TRINITY_DN2680_c0_g1_i1.p1 TRINITY_DN2680_c0_g1~~TRINITY_DN2680_c0_g1_i1.p1  ORF type:complete len:214 (+),score=32.71 TRINITY_DN2680_c0_g1_i1:90-731(+)
MNNVALKKITSLFGSKKYKEGTLVNWRGKNGVPKEVTIKLERDENCFVDYFNCQPKEGSEDKYECTMAGYDGEFEACKSNGFEFQNTYNDKISCKDFTSDIACRHNAWNTQNGADALQYGLTHITISGLQKLTKMPEGCNDYTLGFTVKGLQGTVTLQSDENTNTPQLYKVSSNGESQFPVLLPKGEPYEIMVHIQPEGQTCTIYKEKEKVPN